MEWRCTGSKCNLLRIGENLDHLVLESVLWTQSLVHIPSRQAFERRVAIVKLTADKCICNND